MSDAAHLHNGTYSQTHAVDAIARDDIFAPRFVHHIDPDAQVNADFSGADARGASFERNNMEGVSLRDADLRGAYFGDSLPGVADLEGADFTDASVPPKVLGEVCARPDAKGVNPATGEATRDSLMCP